MPAGGISLRRRIADQNNPAMMWGSRNKPIPIAMIRRSYGSAVRKAGSKLISAAAMTGSAQPQRGHVCACPWAPVALG